MWLWGNHLTSVSHWFLICNKCLSFLCRDVVTMKQEGIGIMQSAEETACPASQDSKGYWASVVFSALRCCGIQRNNGRFGSCRPCWHNVGNTHETKAPYNRVCGVVSEFWRCWGEGDQWGLQLLGNILWRWIVLNGVFSGTPSLSNLVLGNTSSSARLHMLHS